MGDVWHFFFEAESSRSRDAIQFISTWTVLNNIGFRTGYHFVRFRSVYPILYPIFAFILIFVRVSSYDCVRRYFYNFYGNRFNSKTGKVVLIW